MIFIWGSFFNSKISKNLNYKPGSNGHLFTRIREIEKYKNIDILFVGSSHAYRSFDPRIFQKHGINIFNLGSSSQTPLQTKLLLERYLYKINPKLIVYEVYPATFESDGVESAIDFISNSKFNIDLIKMAFKINHLKVYNTMIFRMISELTGEFSNFKESLVRGKDLYIPGGYVERIDTLKNYYQHDHNLKWNINKASRSEFESCLQLIRGHSIKCLLIQTPIRNDFYSSHCNNEEIDHYFRNKALYINFNNSPEMLDTSYFYDEHHLNKTGVFVFNELFIKQIDKIKLLNGTKSSKD